MDTTRNSALIYPRLYEKMREIGEIKNITRGTEILREGQYVKVIPVVQKGLIKVFTRYEDRELLLYYIRPDESCIMSFSAGINNEPSEVFAVTEEDTEALLIPVRKVQALVEENPNGNRFFFQQYKSRYAELLDTIHHVLFSKMDSRLYQHLRDKSNIKGQNPIQISHQQLANELGTLREVISRVMKKLEGEGLVKQIGNSIQVFDR
jgi:CRP/FNR family transcriptional regulator